MPYIRQNPKVVVKIAQKQWKNSEKWVIFGDFRGLQKGAQNLDPLFVQKPECRNAPKTQVQGKPENDPLFDHFLDHFWIRKGSKNTKKHQKITKKHLFFVFFHLFSLLF